MLSPDSWRMSENEPAKEPVKTTQNGDRPRMVHRQWRRNFCKQNSLCHRHGLAEAGSDSSDTFWKIHTRSLMQHSSNSFNSSFDHPHGPTALPAGSDLIRRIHVLTHPKG